jgi:hypothetical protein
MQENAGGSDSIAGSSFSPFEDRSSNDDAAMLKIRTLTPRLAIERIAYQVGLLASYVFTGL